MSTDGRTLGRHTVDFPQHFPEPGWVEHDPEEIWDSVLGSVSEALKKAQAKDGEIAAIGITNQRETTLIWERASGRAIHRAIVWQDRRTASRCAELRAAGHEALVRRTTAIPGDWGKRATRIVTQSTLPALQRQLAELEAQRALAKPAAGIGARPHGEAWYAWALRAATTTMRTPEEVHKLGLEELAALQARMAP